MTLEPGDIVTTGTPAGVGLFQRPPVFMKPGDTIEIEAEGIGILRKSDRRRLRGRRCAAARSVAAALLHPVSKGSFAALARPR